MITLLAALMMMGNYSLRPYLFGNIFFICTLHAMEEPSAGGRIRPVLIFLLFTSWANFHGSFIIGLATIIIYMVASLTLRFRGRGRAMAGAKSYFLDFLVALAACMVTPNHVFGLIFPLMYLQNALSGEVSYLTNISEWQAPGFGSPLGRMITFYLMFCAFALVGSGRSPRAVHVGLLVAFATFSYTTIRNIPLLGIAATPVLARHLPLTLGRIWRVLAGKTSLAGIFDRFHKRSVALDQRSRNLVLPVLSMIVLVIMFSLPASSSLSYRSLAQVGHLSDLSPGFYPRALMEELDEVASDRRIFNYFNWGGAFIWALYPKQRVFIDQRNDCYPMEVFEDYFAVHGVMQDWQHVLDRWRIDLVAYPSSSRLSDVLRESPAWNVLYEDDQSVLFERVRDEALAGKLY
jgi:hypothetical protein